MNARQGVSYVPPATIMNSGILVPRFASTMTWRSALRHRCHGAADLGIRHRNCETGYLGAGTDQRDIRETSETSQRVSDTASTGQVPYNSVSVRIIFPRPRIENRSAPSGQDQK